MQMHSSEFKLQLVGCQSHSLRVELSTSHLQPDLLLAGIDALPRLAFSGDKIEEISQAKEV